MTPTFTSVDVGTLQAMLTQYPKLDITLTAEGGVTPSSEQVGGVTQSFFDNGSLLLTV